MSSIENTSRDTPEVTGVEHHYFTALSNGEFTIQRCKACQKSIFFPRMLCPHCGSIDLEWYKPTGRGTVYSTTVVRRKSDQGGDYNVALIDLDEGPRMMSRVENVAPESVQIGMRVLARVADTAEGKLVVFDPLEAKQ